MSRSALTSAARAAFGILAEVASAAMLRSVQFIFRKRKFTKKRAHSISPSAKSTCEYVVAALNPSYSLNSRFTRSIFILGTAVERLLSALSADHTFCPAESALVLLPFISHILTGIACSKKPTKKKRSWRVGLVRISRKNTTQGGTLLAI